MVTLDMTVDRARDRLCAGMRARRMAVQGIKEQNPAAVAFAVGWLDDILDEIVLAAPDEVKVMPDGTPITGNERPKP